MFIASSASSKILIPKKFFYVILIKPRYLAFTYPSHRALSIKKTLLIFIYQQYGVTFNFFLYLNNFKSLKSFMFLKLDITFLIFYFEGIIRIFLKNSIWCFLLCVILFYKKNYNSVLNMICLKLNKCQNGIGFYF